MKDIILKNLTKSYQNKSVIKDVNFTFKSGEISVIMGKSGEGKTTLIRLLLGLEKAKSGEILNVPKKISAVFQENRLVESMTVVENIMLVREGLTENQVISHLKMVGLEKEAMSKVATLSGGMKRRVAIVRCMIYGGDLIVMDEAFKGLDKENEQITMDYVKNNRNKSTMILITHHQSEAEYFNGKIYTLSNGKLE